MEKLKVVGDVENGDEQRSTVPQSEASPPPSLSTSTTNWWG